MIYPAAFVVGLALGILRPAQSTPLVSALAGSGLGILLTFVLLRPVPELAHFLPSLIWAWVLCAAAGFFGGRTGTRLRRRR